MIAAMETAKTTRNWKGAQNTLQLVLAQGQLQMARAAGISPDAWAAQKAGGSSAHAHAQQEQEHREGGSTGREGSMQMAGAAEQGHGMNHQSVAMAYPGYPGFYPAGPVGAGPQWGGAPPMHQHMAMGAGYGQGGPMHMIAPPGTAGTMSSVGSAGSMPYPPGMVLYAPGGGAPSPSSAGAYGGMSPMTPYGAPLPPGLYAMPQGQAGQSFYYSYGQNTAAGTAASGT